MLSIDPNYILIQLFQPYFYYSTTLLVVSFICIKAIARYNGLLTTRMRSLCYLIPLAIPVLLPALIPWRITWLLFEASVSYNLHNAVLAMPPNHHMLTLPPMVSNYVLKLLGTPSVTNMLLAAGLTVSAFYLLATITLSDMIAKRVFHIVELEPGEYESLQRRIGELSKRLDINTPKIGLVEDLRPNAFTVGYGQRVMLVFSLGILKTLREKELAAVAAHELAHVKNNDFLFKTVSVALTLLSFFNPFAYFASATAQKEREILADEDGARILGQPGLMTKTLVKVYEASRAFPKEGIITRLVSGLFLSSPTSVRSMLSTHPRLDQRVETIRRLNDGKEPTPANPLLSITISILIIAAGIMSTYYLASIQRSFIRQYLPTMVFKTRLEEKGFIPAYSLDSMKRICISNFSRLRNISPNGLNELRPGMMVLKIEEDGGSSPRRQTSFQCFPLKA